MKSSFSQKEIKKLKYYLNKKTILSEQGIGRRLADALANADSAIIKSIKNIDPKIATNFLETEINTFDDLVKHLTVYKSIWSGISKFDWKLVDESVRFLNNASKSGFIKKIPEDEMLQYINDLPTDGDLRGMVFDLWQDSISAPIKSKKTDIKTKVTKNANGENVVIKTKTDGTEEAFNITNNGELKEVDPKDLEKIELKQVAGVKLSDIPKLEYDIIDAALKRYGLENDWGFNPNTGEPIYVTLEINGEKVKLTLNKQGPEQFDLQKISNDKLEEKFKDEYKNTFENVDYNDRPYISDWIKQEKILKDPELRKKYVYRYDVSLGVKLYADDVQGNWGQWVIINPEEIKNYRKTKTVEELKESILHVIYHELTHVIQRNSNQSSASYKSSGFSSGKDAWTYMTGKKTKWNYKNEELTKVSFLDWLDSDVNNVESLIKKFGAEKNIDTSKDYSWKDDFGQWALENNLVPEKFIIKTKQKISKENKINLYGDEVKSRVLRLKINAWADVNDEYKKIKTKTDGLSDEKLLKFINNNIDINEVDNIVKYAAQELSYFSHVKEIEAEFSANIKTLMELGTLEKNKGFATFLVDYLRGTNKSQKLVDINLKKHKSEFDLDLDAKYPNTKNSNDVSTNKLKEFFKKFIDLFLKKNVTNEIKLEKELNSVDGWVNNIPKDFFEVLSKLENEWKKIYPEQANQLEKGLYKQAYELISKGYPALLPFIITEMGDIEEVKNESIIYKKHYLVESFKKAYSFDWDDNILKMPTRIHLEYSVNGLIWVPVSVSTEQFRSVREKIGTEFRYVGNDILKSFKDFRDYEAFLRDVEYAIKLNDFGPSYKDFKEALISGSDFSIITARSNSPKSIKDGIKILIEKTFTDSEIKEMKENLNGISIDEYLTLQDYHPVSSEEFLNKFGLDISSTKPEKGKELAFRDFVDRVIKQIEKIKDDPNFEGISVGYSDDDASNVKSIEELIKNELQKLYPQINFIVYDTSDPNNPKKKRIVIKK